MSDPLLDEDGYCRLSDLLPDQCGCAAHRGGEVIDLTEPRREHKEPRSLQGVYSEKFISAKYAGHCALYHEHVIEEQDIICLAMDSRGQEIGWTCEACCNQIMNDSDR